MPDRRRNAANTRVKQARRTIRAAWAGGIRFPAFAAIMLVIVALGVPALAPTVTSLLQQRQQIAQLQQTVSQKESEVQALRDQQERWNDRTYIVTQARQRLNYVLPGEISYLLIDDRTTAQQQQDRRPPSSSVQVSTADWLATLAASTLAAGNPPQ